MRRILAIGGGGFMMESTLSPIDTYIRELAGVPRPRVCFIPTASGDLPTHIENFYRVYEQLDCEASHLTFFRQADRNAIPLTELASKLMDQDVIFVGGGNTKSALAVWREWGVDEVLRRAWEHGVLLAGMSAGAICWFQKGFTDSFGNPHYRPLPCLGLLDGACSVHHSGDPARASALHDALLDGGLSSTVAIDDFAAILYEGDAIRQCVSWRANATAHRLFVEDGLVCEVSFESLSLSKTP